MEFQPNPNDTLTIDGVTYRIAEHPAAPGIAYGQEGRAGTVYCLTPTPGPSGHPLPLSRSAGEGEGGRGAGVRSALKVFKPRFRLPYLVSQAERIAAFAALPGLAACRRTVLTPSRHADLLRQHPDLTYAVLMPWIEGPTWQEVLLDRRPLSPEQSLVLARGLAGTLVRMEEQGIAHCDLSAPNVMLPVLTPSPAASGGFPLPLSRSAGEGEGATGVGVRSEVQLVDLEGLYAPGMVRPQELSSGSAGYAHRQAAGGLWGPEADRFAGAVLLAEMLGWCDPQVVQAAWGESYFDPAEMQGQGERSRLLSESLRRNWGDRVAALFDRAWHSDTLADCPTFGEWLVALPLQTPDRRPQTVDRPSSPAHGQPSEESSSIVEIRTLMRIAQRLEEQQNIAGALEAYREALSLAQQSQNAALARELEVILKELAKKEPAPAVPSPVSPPPMRQSEPPEDSLEALFDRAQNAMQQQEWTQAHTLLNTIYQRQPDYQRSGQKAWVLLQEADRQMRKALEAWEEIQRFTLKKGWLSTPPAIWAVAFATNKVVYAGCNDGTIWFIDTERSIAERWNSKSPAEILGLAYSMDGILATASRDHTVRLWRVADGAPLRTLEGHTAGVNSVAFSPDGATLASGSDDSTVRLWRVADGAPLRTLGHTAEVWSVAFSPDGATLASGSGDRTVRLWRVSDGAPLRTLEGHTDGVLSVAFSPDGATLASGSGDRTVRLWRVSDGAPCARWKGIPIGCSAWPSRRMAPCWPRGPGTAPCGCGESPMAPPCARWKGIRVRCTAWPSRRMAPCWPRGPGTAPCGCGG